MPKVWNIRDRNVPTDVVYVGRPSIWGNPYHMGTESQRDEVCNAYEQWLTGDSPTSKLVRHRAKKELKGKDLVCYCAPKRCHGDTLLRIANED